MGEKIIKKEQRKTKVAGTVQKGFGSSIAESELDAAKTKTGGAKPTKDKSKSGTKIIVCGGKDCKSTYQDRKYGQDHRVGNRAPGKESGETKAFRCTVCGTIKN